MKAQQPKLILPIGHAGYVTSAFFSHNGQKILTLSSDQTAKIWDSQSGALLADLKHGAWDNTASFSPDDKKILTVYESTVKIWDAQSGTLFADLKGHKGLVASACFSPDGRKIVTAAWGDSAVKIWDVQSASVVGELKVPYTDRVCYSPDGKKILASGGIATIWDAEKDTFAGLADSPGGFNSHTFSPDGRKIMAISGETVSVWDVQTGTLIAKLKGHRAYIEKAYFSPDGKKILTIAFDSTAKIWDAQKGTIIANLNGHTDKIYSACFSPDGKEIVTATSDDVKIWDAVSAAFIADLKGHTYVVSISFSLDGRKIVTASMDGTAKVWDAKSRILLNDLRGHALGLSNAFYSPDGKKIVFSGDSTTKIWDIQNAIVLSELPAGLSSKPYFSLDGKKIITASAGSTVKIWDAQSGQLLVNLKGHSKVIYGASFSPNGKKIITSSADSTAKVWDVQSGALLIDLKRNTNSYYYGAYFSPDGKKIITSRADSIVTIVDAQSGQLLFNLEIHGSYVYNSYVYSACFSPDSKKILTTSGDSTAKIWNAQNGKLIVSFKNPLGMFSNARFSPDGEKIVTGLTEYIPRVPGTSDYIYVTKIWDVQSGQLLADLKGGAISTSYGDIDCFSPDGKEVVTTSPDFSTKIWDVQRGKLLVNLIGHTGAIVGTCFSPDSKKIVTVSADHTAKIWDASGGSLLYTFFALDNNKMFVQVPLGYYKCSPEAAGLLHYVTKDLRVITFEQLDVKYNRPDLVLETIGCPDTSLIKSYKKAWHKRIAKLGFDTSLFKEGSLHVPESDFQNRDRVEYEQKSKKLFLTIIAKDDSIVLDRYNMWINEVPLFGVRGISLKSRNTKYFDTTVTITLSNGTNRIESSVTNVGGLESYRIPLDVKYTAPQPAKEKLYFIGIGIDHFKDSIYNLSWSVKDIRDLAGNFWKKYDTLCIIDTLFDKDVSTKKVIDLKQHLLKTTENDKVIIAYSGHGLLSKDYDYFLSTYNVNFQEPQKEGLPYELLEDLLDSIPARKKLILIDACHSGEVDKEELSKMVQVQAKLDSTKGVIVLIDSARKRLGTKSSFELMQDLFVNVGRSTGATVISAAAGTQFALEKGNLKNGVFSYCILELMKKNTPVTISELKKYVNQRVTELTAGMQVPTSRVENKVMDWLVW